MKRTSRRRFLKLAATSGGLVAVGSVARRSMAWGLPRPKVKVVPPLTLFRYGQVEMLEGRLRQQFEENHRFFLNLDEDGMLKPFRQRQGLAAPGPDLGGWYDNGDDFDPDKNFHGFVPGHSFGQYLSGLARAYAVTGSKQTQEKVHRLVKAFGATVEPTGKFYVDYRLPGYTFDKTMCGLIDAHEFAGDPMAREVLRRSVDAALPHLPEKALSRVEMAARPHKSIANTWDETYTLAENFFLAYQRLADERYRDLGQRFIYHEYFDALAQDQNALPGKHAYSHVNALSSAMQSYLVLGDEKHLRAATNGLRMVNEQSYATGGWGPREAFVEPGKGLLGKSLNETRASFETPCGAYGHFKIARYLLRVTGDSRYGDSMERVLYNTVAGAKPTLADGTTFYYSDYNSDHGQKVYSKDKWPCCSGTFPQLAADYHISAYYRAADGIYVNLFVPSRVRWEQNGTHCELTQRTEYPRANSTTLMFNLARPETFTTYLRIPAWADGKTRVAINGKRVEEEVVPGKFLALRRPWKNGDRVEFEIGMPLRLEAVDGMNPNIVALIRGPIALFAVGDLPAKMTRAELLAAVAVTEGSEDWVASGDSGKITLRPFAAIGDESYRLYQSVGA